MMNQPFAAQGMSQGMTPQGMAQVPGYNPYGAPASQMGMPPSSMGMPASSMGGSQPSMGMPQSSMGGAPPSSQPPASMYGSAPSGQQQSTMQGFNQQPEPPKQQVQSSQPSIPSSSAPEPQAAAINNARF